MKKAVIETGAKQYLVHEGEELAVELSHADDAKTLTFQPLLVIDGDKTEVGKPELSRKVTAEIVDADQKADKVLGVRFKAKKRVRKTFGHRQRQTILKIVSIA